jgi:pimeloyl-ACP methyl ester carboxylesterase
MSERHELRLPDARVLVVHDTGPQRADAPTVVWHQGSPQSGVLLPPVVDAAAARGLRVVSCARAGYGGSTRLPGRSVADAASDVAHALDRLGVERCYAVGASGGGPHALALAALCPERVAGVVTLAGVAPYDGTEEWFAGMADDAALRAALDGTESRATHEETAEFDPASFTSADHAMFDGPWDVAFVRPWGVELAAVEQPVLVVQGGEDRMIPRHHADLLLGALPAGELWLRPRDGHVGVLAALPVTLDWLRALD